MMTRKGSLCFAEEERNDRLSGRGSEKMQWKAFSAEGHISWSANWRRQVVCQREGDECCHCVICQPYLFIGRGLLTGLIRVNHLISFSTPILYLLLAAS